MNYNYHDTPLHLAAYRGHRVVCKFLLDHGASLQIKNVKGKTCIDEAKNQSHNDLYTWLLMYQKGQLSDITVIIVQKCGSQTVSGAGVNFQDFLL
jgi:ankyrin repeat protein